MSSPICEVTKTIRNVSDIVSSGRLTYPRCRHRAEELLKLLEDASWGRGGPEHFTAMETLARTLMDEGPDKACIEVGEIVWEALRDHSEVFSSHIETHICPTGECVKLAPAPCQIACPAG